MAPDLWIILVGWALAGGSPGPATLAISGAAMGSGRASGLAVATGVLCGSALWGIAAALGMSALMLANAWVFEVIRYVGAAYLLWLAIKSLRNAWRGRKASAGDQNRSRLFLKGFLIHLTNPKAIFSWGAIFAIALPSDPTTLAIWKLFGALYLVSMALFWGYALLFSAPWIARGYRKATRWFDAAFGLLFGAASLRILTAKINP